ncbi:MAG: type I restriction endonuclease subunit R [Gammaproteobacteria bacterium]|nr:type I restriction endonuclease subunit R [Gammaproteobacteria bacterium]
MGLSCFEYLNPLVPVVQLLSALNWKYLNREEALFLRNGRKDQAVLTGILAPWLDANNRINVKGGCYPFTQANVNEAIRRLTDIPPHGLVKTNEEIYHLLTLGASVEQTIQGDRKGHTLKYIDWQHPENNHYHLVHEFSLERARAYETCQLDVVLFVNGIPFVVIECQRQHSQHRSGEHQVEQAIERLIHYQSAEQIPQLFHYVQLLFATHMNETRYATIGTAPKFWSKWEEDGCHEQAINAAANRPLSNAILSILFSEAEEKPVNADDIGKPFIEECFAGGNRVPTVQDATLWAMLRPFRLLGFIYQFVVYDAGVRKVARYQQYFAVKAAIKKIATLRGGRRTGGVVWHTTGSGKSLTMVMMAKAVALSPDILNPQVVLVTDRVDLDDQLWRTFDACGKTAMRAKTGEHLVRLITDGNVSLITTVIDKFSNVITKYAVSDSSPNIFVLVDEGHRSNYGVFAERMRKVFSNACYIGFTGTPLLLKDKNTIDKFGGFIHRYTLRQAVADEAIVPLLYEGRMALLMQNSTALQARFERLANNLAEEQKSKLIRRLTTKQVVNDAAQRIKYIALDVSAHYAVNYQGTGLKAQLATNSRAEALQYRHYINEYALISCELIMSQPTVSEGQDSNGEEQSVKRFWNSMMARFGSEEEYVRQIKASFSREDGCDLLIVVDKLLTGFDEPRNTVLYIDKSLKGHNLLQAIARVNRLFTGKQFGLLVDYRGVLGDLNDAMQRYDALTGFDGDDVDFRGVVIDTHEKIANLQQAHTELWAVFDVAPYRQDIASMLRYLYSENKQQAFYRAFKRYQNILSVALATEHFYQDVAKQKIDTYKNDLNKFYRLRLSMSHRSADVMDVERNERQLRKIIDSHLHTTAIVAVTKITDIFDIEAFNRELEEQVDKVAKADMIASRVKMAIEDKMTENEVFYKKISRLIQRTIDEFHAGRINDSDYLSQQTKHLNTIRRGYELSLPAELQGHREAQALFNLLSVLFLPEGLSKANATALQQQIGLEISDGQGIYTINRNPLTQRQIVQMALDIESIIDNKKIRDWPLMDDVVKDMQNAIDDYLFDTRDRWGVDLSTQHMDTIIEHCISIARNRGR